ncbi:MAG: TetR/AcrR family transcriptional regulator [Fimbriimonas sp.]
MALITPRTETRDAILDACDGIMARWGFRKMTMDDLAKEAGVSKRTIYEYFPSKLEVGLSSIGRVVQTARDEMAAIGQESAPPADRLRRMLERRVMARVLAVQDYHQSLDELFEAVRPAYMARRRETFEIEAGLIADVLRIGRSAGNFRFEDATATAETLLLATNAFLPYSLSVRELGQPDAIQARLRTMVELLVRGLASR